MITWLYKSARHKKPSTTWFHLYGWQSSEVGKSQRKDWLMSSKVLIRVNRSSVLVFILEITWNEGTLIDKLPKSYLTVAPCLDCSLLWECPAT